MTETGKAAGFERALTVRGYSGYGLLGWTSVLLPALIIPIEADFHRNDADIGIVFFFAALLYGVGALTGGFITEHTGARVVLIGAFSLLAFCTLAGSGIRTWALFAALFAIGKLANGSIDAGFGALFLEAFAERRATALNLLHLFYGVGALIGPVVVGLALTVGLSWRIIFVATGLFAVISAVGMARLSMPHTKTAKVAEVPADITFGERERSLVPFVWLAVAMAFYEAQVIGMTAWIVRYLRDDGVGIATSALTAFWLGVCASRLSARWLSRLASTRRLGLVLMSGTTVFFFFVLLSPWVGLTVVLLVVAGFLSGPIYPLLVMIGGDFYPRRLARLSGGITAAATVGALTYPPLIGLIATHRSVRAGLIGAAALGIPAVVAIILAFRAHAKVEAQDAPYSVG